jgi:hypothetical protein
MVDVVAIWLPSFAGMAVHEAGAAGDEALDRPPTYAVRVKTVSVEPAARR